MASKDDSPTSLHGQPWSVWADRLGRDSPLSDTDDQSKVNQTKEGDAMKLPKQDMPFYGLCPVRDEFYLVTCNYCQRVCTPQGLKNHIELKHVQEWNSCHEDCVATAPVSSTAKPKAAKKAALPTSLAYLLATPAAPAVKPRGAKRVANIKPTAAKNDKIPSPPPPFSPLTAPSPVSPITMTVAVDSCGNQTVEIHLPEIGNLPDDSPAKKQRKNSRNLPIKERELDLERHCGVWIGEVHRACTRSLTCKAHSLTLRRAVQGRSRSFDDLLAEHRAAKEQVLKQLPTKIITPSAVPKLGRPPRPVQPKKQPELTLEVPTEVNQYPTSGLLQRVFPPAVSLSFTAHHPKPLAVCSFGLRRQGAAVTADRKWDYLRTTLRATFKRQLRPSNSIELPNGLQLSIGVQPDGSNHHRLRLKKSMLNGQEDDLMEGFDGLVGEDGVLTFLNQNSEGTASLSLMADLSAGNITFSELNQAGAANRLPASILQPDPGDPMSL